MELGIQSRDLAVQDLFAPGERLSMPSYQRSYSWGDREATALLQDLLDAAELDELHFIGAIVVNTAGQFNSLEIVDGQQRLTTLTILLCLLRDTETDPAIVAQIQSLIFDDPDPERGEPGNYRLNLNQLDADFFRRRIQTPGEAIKQNLPEDAQLVGSQHRITEAAKAMGTLVERLDLEAKRGLVKTITARCALVRVTVDNRDRGYQVYRVLNTRGREPNSHDIIKTELFETARFDRETANAYSAQWAEYEAQLGSDPLDDLLRQIRALYDRNAKGDLVSGFKKAVAGKVSPRDFLETEMPAFVAAFIDLNTGRMGAQAVAKGINDYLNRMRALDHSGWKAPALKFLMERGVDDPAAEDFFWGLERLGYVIQLVVHKREQRVRRYRKVIDALMDDDALFAADGPLSIDPEEAFKVRERLTGRFATFSQRRAMALRLNAAVEGGCTLPPEADATVEHVLPRNPPAKSLWLTTWPDTGKRRELCDTLGNFVLLSHEQNRDADRQTYRDKKRVYFGESGETPFALTRDLKEQDAWTAEIVRERTIILASILAQHWKLP
ncbi:MAG: DUF262 domain-containing HNH endonuclease family protein [Pseudomonadota bacterium]